MSTLQQDSKLKISLGQDGNSLVYLVAFNAIAYAILGFLKVVWLVNGSVEETYKAQVFSWLSVPAQPAVFATRPWTLISYMFAHFEFLDLLSGMLWLWAFGYILQSLAGNRKLIPVYIYGGLIGAVAFLLASNLIPVIRVNVNSVYPLLGSGSAVMAVATAVTTLFPKYRIFPMLRFPLWGLTAVFVFIKLGTVIGTHDYPQAIALAAAAGTGWLFAWQLQKGNDWGQWMSEVVNWVNDLFNPAKKREGFSPKEQLFYKNTTKPFEKTPHVTQQRVDDLLDKINIRGYHSLTDDEKDFLKKASREEL